MSRHLFVIPALALGFAAPARAADAPPKTPNILWLIAEDLGPELNCYGYTNQVWTPNLDRLAAEGVRYTRAYTTAPVCSASRSAFMTGMYQTTIGAHNHRSHRDDGYQLPQGVRVLTEWLKDAGYSTANLAQMPAAFGFRGTAKTDWNFTPPKKPFEFSRWPDLKTHQPFYAQINFHETHRPYKGAPKKADPAKVTIPPYYPDHPVTRSDWAAYLDAASELDRKVGLILKQLEADGLADNTLVLFIGDHGQSHVRGKQFCYEEGLHIPLLIRWPRAFPVPAGFKPGTVDDRLVEAIDFAPTMLSIAGVTKPEKMQGRVLFGDHADQPRQYAFGARDRCDETVFRLRTVRDDRYRYIRNFTPDRPFLQANEYKERQYPVWNLLKQLHAEGKLTPVQERLCAPTMPPEELYDLQRDPDEIDNLADKPEHQETLKRLRGVLEKWIEETNDHGRTFEPPEVAANRGATKKGSNPNAGAQPAAAPKPQAAAPAADRPNVVIVLADDLGYGDVGCFGSNTARTPNIDRMAAECIKLTDFYVAQAVCSASRTALLTGCYPNRVGILGALGPAAKIGISDGEMTLGQLFKSRGYATAVYGKWHLGHHPQFLPTRHGFDDYFGLPYSNDMWPKHPTAKFPDLPVIDREQTVAHNPDMNKLTGWYTERAVRFIREHKDRPFFLYVPQTMVHVPLGAGDRFRGKSKGGLYGDAVEEVDWSVGQILAALKEQGLDEKTLVLFTSDNGPWLSYGNHGGSAGPLREGKGTSFEGGVREPFVARWPGHIKPGTISHTPLMTIDLFPTFARLIGAELPKHAIDGREALPVLLGEPAATNPHEAYYFYWGRELQAVRSGKWKLHFPHDYRSLTGTPGHDGKPGGYSNAHIGLSLFDLEADVGEKTNVADQHPDVVKRLQALADKERDELGDSRTKKQGKGVRQPGKVQD
ncbi:MAG TPA: sulfatase-like hydrolase/transferase [Gemmataceae bacterium]